MPGWRLQFINMSTPEKTSNSGRPGDSGLSVAELKLGSVLALIHRILPHIDEPDHAVRVQTDLRRAAALIESAREAHSLDTGVTVGSQAAASVTAETVAVIAAAIAVLLGRP